VPEIRASASAGPVVGILHYTCPPVVGGVEWMMAQHAGLLIEHGMDVRVLAGRGGRFRRDAPLDTIPALDSKYPALLEVNDELQRGEVSERFDALVGELTERLRTAFAGLDACIVHNALSLHFNLPLTAALWNLARAGEAPLIIAWCHDLAWTNPLYTPLMRERLPWSLLKSRLPGARYVVVSEDRRRDLLALWGTDLHPPAPSPSHGGRGDKAALGGRKPSPSMGEGWVEATDDPVVIPAGIDRVAKLRLRSSTVALARQLRFDDAWPFMLLPARITKRKNIEYAIRVTRALRDLGRKPLLLVTGPPGPHNVRSVDYVDELQAERAALDVRDEVVFLYEERRPGGRGWRATDAMMDDLYQLADLLLFPSAQEGFGIPLLEAGLVRLPVFGSDIPPFREIAGADAHLFDLNEPPLAVAERISTFLDSDPSVRLRRRVLDAFTWEGVFAGRIAPLLAPLARASAATPPGSSSLGPATASDTKPATPLDDFGTGAHDVDEPRRGR